MIGGNDKTANIIKPMQTHIYRKKYVNWEGYLKKYIKKTKRYATSGLDLSIYAIKSPLQLAR